MSADPTPRPIPMRSDESALDALSPLDGRYARRLGPLRAIFSEAALIRQRVRIEALWFKHLAGPVAMPGLTPLAAPLGNALAALVAAGRANEAPTVKAIERRTNHDVKAVEYYVRDVLSAAGASEAQLEFVHFGCTSEDINNLCYALMLKRARSEILLPALKRLVLALASEAKVHAGLAMLARTHGQPASPTTLGKELANVARRLERGSESFAKVVIAGKMNGAVGNYNAHVAACPEIDWRAVTGQFVESLGLAVTEYTTQIEPHDWIAEYCDALARTATVLIGFCRDVWGYVSLGYFRQRPQAGEVGSSTMPHKVNPIDFENAEGNLGVGIALLRHLSEKLPVSRWQRDLTDSTVLRNAGVAIGYVAVALDSIERGLARLEPDSARIAEDLDQHWEVLAEAVQTVLRRHGVPEAYERLKALSHGQALDRATLHAFIRDLPLPAEARNALLALTPASYTGLAESLARDAFADRKAQQS
jgi:adenylosuccinate lyase